MLTSIWLTWLKFPWDYSRYRYIFLEAKSISADTTRSCKRSLVSSVVSCLPLDHPSTSPIYGVWNSVIILPAGGLALYGAKPSAGTVLTANVRTICFKDSVTTKYLEYVLNDQASNGRKPTFYFTRSVNTIGLHCTESDFCLNSAPTLTYC